MKQSLPIFKVTATIGGTLLTSQAAWLNAVHVASSEGWGSPLVFAGVFVTLCAASAPPLAERAAKDGQWLKSILIWVFFTLALGFSLSSSIARSSGYASGKIAQAEQTNEKAKLAEEAYAALKQSVAGECKKRGPKCRELEDKLSEARKALATAAPVVSTDPGAERVAAVLGIKEASVQLYGPLLLPLGLELGGFIFLALGLAPAKREDEVANERETANEVAKLVAIAADPIANAPVKAAKTIPNKAYYLQRLQRDFPELAKKVSEGQLSVYKASVEAGLRKATKQKKWNANDYVKETKELVS